MSTDKVNVSPIRIANDSGFPLQIAIQNQVDKTCSSHGWSVRYVEHSWVNPTDQRSGFIDIVLQNQAATTFLVVECKRVRGATWVFMHPDGDCKDRGHAKVWISHYENDNMKRFDWEDIVPEPFCPEAVFCAVRGQSSNDKTTMIERTAGELVSATEALALEEKNFHSGVFSDIRFYFNVIVTTAELKVAEFDSQSISLSDGSISDAQIRDVPYVRFRKQLSARPNAYSMDDYMRSSDVIAEKENTVFVVRAEALTDFLQEFNVPDRFF